MKTEKYSSVDPNTGNIKWDGPLVLQKGNHDHMPPRTEAYLPGKQEIGTYDRGLINASSLGGTNIDNIAPQHCDINRAGGAYYAMEQGERSAIRNGADIHSTKTAVVDGQIGDKPQVFMVTDQITYTDGHMVTIHHSFLNASYQEQQIWNDQSAALPGSFDAPNPDDVLRESMSNDAYATMMTATDAELPGITEDYSATGFSGVPDSDSLSTDSSTAEESMDYAVDTITDADAFAEADSSIDCVSD